MTRLAGGGADRNVIGRRSGRLHIVMAARAIARDAAVVEPDGRKADRGMADIALQVRLDVHCSLALRLHAVVAGGAAPAGFGVIEVDSGLPRVGSMAAIATIAGHDVVGRLGRRANRRPDAMAGAALVRSALENCIRVTRLTR